VSERIAGSSALRSPSTSSDSTGSSASEITASRSRSAVDDSAALVHAVVDPATVVRHSLRGRQVRRVVVIGTDPLRLRNDATSHVFSDHDRPSTARFSRVLDGHPPDPTAYAAFFDGCEGEAGARARGDVDVAGPDAVGAVDAVADGGGDETEAGLCEPVPDRAAQAARVGEQGWALVRVHVGGDVGV